MAKFFRSATFIVLICLCFLLFAGHAPMVKAKTCERRSKTWSGFCGDSNHCDQQCKNWEGAQHGACHLSGLGRACFCYFKC
ncbi:hypothetical protein BT93_G1043 [Corymbia citriodora subsp. variegata]|nr:hypothetical protein BT93_G1043 [Corymbia citriodora subsp. variegata]